MLGFIIFGWPTKQKHIGATSPGYCDHCANHALFHLHKTRMWFSLFWVPLFPLGRANYFLSCEICGAGIELEKHEAKKAKELVEKTKARASEQISQAEYDEQIADFERLLSPEEASIESSSNNIKNESISLEDEQTQIDAPEQKLIHAMNEDRVTTKHDLVSAVYHESPAYEDEDNWWNDFAKPELEEHADVEQLDSTGLRWKLDSKQD